MSTGSPTASRITAGLLAGLFVATALSLAAPSRNLLANGSFTDGTAENGVPLHWEGNPERLAVVEPEYAPGTAVLEIRQGGSISQAVPARPGLSYRATLRADTSLFEEPEAQRYRTQAYVYLMFLPSNERVRTEMISPFGDGAELVSYTVGGTAPEGTESVHVQIVSGRSDCTIADVRLIEHEDSYAHFRLKELHLETPVVRDGKAVAQIVVPESGVHDGEAKTIVESVRELTGVAPDVVSDSTLDLCRDQRLTSDLIVLGNRNTSQVVSDLYDMYYVILDLLYPGQGGSVVRSLHDPFGDGHNVIFVGASDAEGMRKAATAFVNVLDRAQPRAGHLSLGYLAEIELGSDVNIPETMSFDELKKMKPWGATNRTGGYGWTVISKALAYYYMTGYESYAREFMRLAFPDEEAIKDLASCGQDFRGGGWREPLVDVYHYRAHLPVVYWDLVEESPFFSDADRERVTKQFMKQLKTFRSNPDYGCGTDKLWHPVTTINTRHHQWAAMTFYTLGRYLGRDYPDAEWQVVRRSAEYFFSPLYLRHRVWNRGEGARLERLPTTLASVFSYALVSGNKCPVELGSLKDQARNMELLVDWKKNSWVLRQAPSNLYNQMAYLLNERRYADMRELIRVDLPYSRPGQSYWPDKDRMPVTTFGINRWERLDPTPEEFWFWELLWEQELADRDRMFRLASYRTRHDGQGDFLLVDGVFLGGVYHCCALLEYMINGDILFLGQRTHLNFMSAGMTAAKQPKYSELTRCEAVGSSAVLTGGAPDYNFADWQRTFLHRAGQYTLVIDKLVSQRDAAFCTAEVNWALAPEVVPLSTAPGVAVLRAPMSDAREPLLDFHAIAASSTTFASDLPADKILRASYDAVTLINDRRDSWLTVTFELDHNVTGEMVAVFAKGNNRGLVSMALDGEVLVEELDVYGVVKAEELKVKLGRQRLAAGKHVIRLQSLGPGPNSAGAFISFQGFQVVREITVREYVLGCSDKLATLARDMGTAIGSAASGGCVSAVWNGSMQQGQEKLFFSLVSLRTADSSPENGNCLRLAPNAAVLALPAGSALAVKGNHENISADVAVLGSDHLAAYGATRCGGFLESDRPIDVDWTFADGEMAIHCRAACVVTVATGSGEAKLSDLQAGKVHRKAGRVQLELEPGRHRLHHAEPDGAMLAAHTERCRTALEQAVNLRSEAVVIEAPKVTVSVPDLGAAWVADVGTFPRDLQVFEARGKTFIAAAVDDSILLLDAAGNTRRRLDTEAAVKVVHYWPEAGVITGGSQDFKVTAFDPLTGERRWVFESVDINPVYKKSGFTAWCDRNPPWNKGVFALHSGTFLDGKSQLLLGTACTVEALDVNGQLVKSMIAGAGVVMDMALLDCGDGEVWLMPASPYSKYTLYQTCNRDPDNPRRRSVGEFAPRRGASTCGGDYFTGYVDLEAVDVDGDGRQELVGLFNGTLNGIHVWDSKGQVLGDAAFGDGRTVENPSHEKAVPRRNMRGLAIADLTGNGRKELCVITSRGFLIVLSDRCEKLWSRRLPSEPLAITAFAATGERPGRVVVGCRGGGVFALDADGAFVEQRNVGAAVVSVARLDSARAVTADDQGKLRAWKVR